MTSTEPKPSEKPIGPAKGKTAVEALITGGAIALALILVNVLVSRSPARLDLTENHIYSLSDSSKRLVRGMKERVNIRAYFGNVPAEQAEKANYVDMLLAEYAESSNGKIDYQKIDPWDKPELQEELKKDGIDKLRLQSRSDDAIQLVPMYFQVVFSHLDKKEIWTPEATFTLEGLEYEFSSRIKRLGNGKKKVAVTAGFGESADIRPLQMQGQEVMPGLKIGLGDLYDIAAANWKTDPKSIDDADVLIVNGPTDKISDAAKFHLDQRLMRGKPVLFLMNGMKWQGAGQQQQQMQMPDQNQPYLGIPNDNGLEDMLAGYGFEIGKNVVLDLRNTARYWLPVGGRQGLIRPGFAPLAQVLAGGSHDILANMQALALPFPSTLKLVGPLAADKRDADTTVVELLKTLPTSFEHDEVLAITEALQPPAAKNGKGPYLLAAAASTKLKSFYADHPLPADPNAGTPSSDGQGMQGMPPGMMMPNDGEADPPPAAPPAEPTGPLKESAAHTRLVVVAAPSIASTEVLIYGQNAGEIVYVNNIVATHDLVDWLAEDEDLVAVRSKKIDRPIPKLESGERNLIKYANIVGAPLLLVAFGIGYWRVRESRRKRISL